MRNKSICRLCAILFALFALFSCAAPAGTEGKDEDYAVFFYVSGADLEENSHAASDMISALLSCDMGKNLSVYLKLGGSRNWENDDVDSSSVSTFKIEDGSLLLIQKEDSRSMGDTQTLASYIDFADGVRSDRKVLVFWGHGSTTGLLVDPVFDDQMTFAELKEGLGDSFFDLIVFNACYTANFDLMSYIAPNASFAIASEDTFPSTGLDYPRMVALLKDNDGRPVSDIARGIIDATEKKYAGSDLADSLTMSLISLKDLQANRSLFEAYFGDLLKDTGSNERFLGWLKLANRLSESNGDFFDLPTLLDEEREGRLSEAIQKIIPYETHGGREGYGGLYLFYKLKVTRSDLAGYVENSYYTDYYALLQHKEAFSNDRYIQIVRELRYPDDSTVLTIAIDNPSYLYAYDYSYTLYDENLGVVQNDCVFLDAEYNATKDETDIAVDRKALFHLCLTDGKHSSVLSYSFLGATEGTGEKSILYYAEATIDQKSEVLLFSYTYDGNPDEGKYETIGLLKDVYDGQMVTEDLPGYRIEKVALEDRTGCSLSIDILDVFGTFYSSDIVRLA